MEYLIVGQPGVMIRCCLQRIRRRGQGCRYYQPNKQEDFFPSIIDDLGGGRLLAKNLSKFTNTVLNEKTVYSWKQQGIPDKWKHSIIKLLIKSGGNVPKGLIPPGMNLNNFEDSFSKNTNLLSKYDDFNENEITKPTVRNGISLFFVMCILLMIK